MPLIGRMRSARSCPAREGRTRRLLKRAIPVSCSARTLMQPFGGAVVHRLDPSPEHLARLGGFFRNGDFTQEIVQAIASGDVAVLVTIERQSVEVGGLPRQEWPLRVTLVFRREDGEWRLAHRHADPLVRGISLDQAAALARGEDAPEHDARAEDERAGGERGGGARGGGTRVSVSRHPLGEPGGG